MGGDGLVLMPTGGGKSLCYQIPGLMRKGVTVVISPLISLMQDQVQTLCELGFSAYAYNSTLSLKNKRQIEKELLEGTVEFLYLAPERLMSGGTMALLEEIEVRHGIGLFAIDEAHCVSKWGHDFRPEYRKLSILARNFPDVPRLALTATADKFTRADIIKQLKLESARVFLGSFDRPNLFYSLTQRERQGSEQLKTFLKGREEESGIVYCLSRRKVEETALYLQSLGLNAYAYHAGLDANTRRVNQETFLQEEACIIVATIAFGMGIDKPDVRYVVHMDLPKNIENYYQETGRAGRDGLPADLQLFYGARDVVILKQMMRKGSRDANRFYFESENLEGMHSFAMAATCRRQSILQTFDEDFRGPCGNCDNCVDEDTYRHDGTQWVKSLLELFHRTKSVLTFEEMVELARGTITSRAREFKWYEFPNFGFAMETAEKGVQYGVREIIAAGLLKRDWAKGGALALTPLALDFIQNGRPFFFQMSPKDYGKKSKAKSSSDKSSKKTKKRTKKATKKRTTAKPRASKKAMTLREAGKPGTLLSFLKEVRRSESKKRKVPAYKVFHDQTLMEMAAQKPGDLDEFLLLHGVGDVKAKKYGKIFLKAIEDFSP